jgi:hypothetical protein
VDSLSARNGYPTTTRTNFRLPTCKITSAASGAISASNDSTFSPSSF